MYSVGGYGQMIADRARVAAYREAMQRSITPGCVVLDIGTGTGFFAMLACRLGAGKVYAVEPDDVIELARTIARDNGYAGRIEFIQDLSTRIDLPEPVDVVVSDLRTILPWFQHHVPTIADARARLLKPGGVLIPQQDVLWAAVVEMPELYARFVGHQAADTDGFDMSAAHAAATNVWTKVHATPDQLLTEPCQWASLDYRTVEDARAAGAVDVAITRPGTAHGVIAWFDATLVDGVGFSNSPGQKPMLYGQAFFPWPEPVSVEAGDSVAVKFHATCVEGDYLWHWGAKVRSANKAEVAAFSQTNFRWPASREALQPRAASHVPNLSEQGRISRFILDRMDMGEPLQRIAEAVSMHFPERYPTWESALDVVGDISVRYGQ